MKQLMTAATVAILSVGLFATNASAAIQMDLNPQSSTVIVEDTQPGGTETRHHQFTNSNR